MKDLKQTLLDTSIFIDNEYLDLYVKLIESNVATKKQKYKTQVHHILPKYYFKFNNITDKSIINSKDNLVNFLYKDHILAHYYLALCSLDDFVYSNQMAIKYMVDKKICDTSFLQKLDKYQYLYEDSKLRFAKLSSSANKGRKHSNEYRENCRKRATGKYPSEETRKKMSISQKKRKHIFSQQALENIKNANRRKHTEEQNIQHSLCMTGRKESDIHKAAISNGVKEYYKNMPKQIYIIKDSIVKRIKEVDFIEYGKDGWERGRGSNKPNKS